MFKHSVIQTTRTIHKFWWATWSPSPSLCNILYQSFYLCTLFVCNVSGETAVSWKARELIDAKARMLTSLVSRKRLWRCWQLKLELVEYGFVLFALLCILCQKCKTCTVIVLLFASCSVDQVHVTPLMVAPNLHCLISKVDMDNVLDAETIEVGPTVSLNNVGSWKDDKGQRNFQLLLRYVRLEFPMWKMIVLSFCLWCFADS
jgi:hypothetical protein